MLLLIRSQYGLSFIHLFEPEKDAEATDGEQAERATEAAGAGEASDDDEFRPGELFALHRAQNAVDAADTGAAAGAIAHFEIHFRAISNRPLSISGAQIRRASAQAMKNISDSSTKLTKTQIDKAGGAERELVERDAEKDKRRHASGDESVAASHASTRDSNLGSTPSSAARRDLGKRKRPDGGTSHVEHGGRPDEGGAAGDRRIGHSFRSSGAAGVKKGRRDEGAVLRGVVFALSGYANPRRAAVRDLGLRLGARYRPDWGPDCTHLV